ncbi:Antifreeze protein, type I [Rhodobacter sp.]
MKKLPSPGDTLALSVRTGMMLVEAQMVIGMRMLGMMGLWRVAPTENSRMLTEKLAAGSEATIAASKAVLAGKSPVAVAEAALKPVRRRTRANTGRLAWRGPKV